MFYTTYKLFVSSKNTSEFNELFNKRYNSESTIHLPLLVNGSDAFIYLHPEIINQIATVYSLDKKVYMAFDKLPGVAKEQYIKKSLIDEIKNTNDIEHVISTRKEIRDILDDISSKDKENSKIIGIVNTYKTLLNDSNISIKTSVDIRKLYDLMLLEEIEKEDKENIPDGIIFRKKHVHVYKGNDEEIHTGVYPEDNIISYMDTALNFLNDESIDLLIRVAGFHYLFGYIHPFYDGNGRMSRFISSYLLSKSLTRIIGFRLSMTVQENLKLYYDSFKYTNDIRNKGDITTFVNGFLSIIIKAMEQTITYASEKKEELNHYQEKINTLKFKNKFCKDILYYLVQAELFSKFGLCNNELSKISEHSKKTCYNCALELMNNDLVSVVKSGNTVFYKANLNIIDSYMSED